MGIIIKGRTVFGPNIVTDGLVLYLDAANPKSYPGTGNTWYDISQYHNKSTLINNPIYYTNYNGYFEFNGSTSSSSSLTYNSQYNIREAITFSIFFKRNSSFNQNTDYHILSRPPAWFFYDSYNSGAIRGDVYIDGIRRAAVTVDIPYDNKWYNIVYTYNSITHVGKMYKNGIFISSRSETGLSNYLIDESYANFINIGSAGVYNRIGHISSLSLYNRALADNEVLQNYNAFKSRF
jgi:hypothetical protein